MESAEFQGRIGFYLKQRNVYVCFSHAHFSFACPLINVVLLGIIGIDVGLVKEDLIIKGQTAHENGVTLDQALTMISGPIQLLNGKNHCVRNHDKSNETFDRIIRDFANKFYLILPAC